MLNLDLDLWPFIAKFWGFDQNQLHWLCVKTRNIWATIDGVIDLVKYKKHENRVKSDVIFPDVISLLTWVFILWTDGEFEEGLTKKNWKVSLAYFFIYNLFSFFRIIGHCDLDLWPIIVNFVMWPFNKTPQPIHEIDLMSVYLRFFANNFEIFDVISRENVTS